METFSTSKGWPDWATRPEKPSPSFNLSIPATDSELNPSVGCDGQHPGLFVQHIDSPGFDLHHLQSLVQGALEDAIRVQGLAHRGGDGLEGCQFFGPRGHPPLQVSVGPLIPNSLFFFLFLKRAIHFRHSDEANRIR